MPGGEHSTSKGPEVRRSLVFMRICKRKCGQEAEKNVGAERRRLGRQAGTQQCIALQAL